MHSYHHTGSLSRLLNGYHHTGISNDMPLESSSECSECRIVCRRAMMAVVPRLSPVRIHCQNMMNAITYVYVLVLVATMDGKTMAFVPTHHSPCLMSASIVARKSSIRRRPMVARDTDESKYEDGYSYAQEQQQIEFRPALIKDLQSAADLMMQAFYHEKSIMFHYYRMLELNRLQSNFPYDRSKHEFYVACDPNNRVIGFVDVDARPSSRANQPPRPYLSDLAVDSDYRRRGIATSLVEMCEEKARSLGCCKLYLRVEGANDAALSMYCHNLGYEKRKHPIFGVKDTTILLRCDLTSRKKVDDARGKVLANDGSNSTSTDFIDSLDYQV